MKKTTGSFFVALIVMFGVASAINAEADEPGQDSFREASSVERGSDGSAGSLDPRLPPVIPGEEIQRGRKKIKVWSTSGSVSVAEPPAPPSAPSISNRQGSAIGNVGVVVDGRSYIPPQTTTGSGSNGGNNAGSNPVTGNIR